MEPVSIAAIVTALGSFITSIGAAWYNASRIERLRSNQASFTLINERNSRDIEGSMRGTSLDQTQALLQPQNQDGDNPQPNKMRHLSHQRTAIKINFSGAEHSQSSNTSVGLEPYKSLKGGGSHKLEAAGKHEELQDPHLVNKSAPHATRVRSKSEDFTSPATMTREIFQGISKIRQGNGDNVEEVMHIVGSALKMAVAPPNSPTAKGDSRAHNHSTRSEEPEDTGLITSAPQIGSQHDPSSLKARKIVKAGDDNKASPHSAPLLAAKKGQPDSSHQKLKAKINHNNKGGDDKDSEHKLLLSQVESTKKHAKQHVEASTKAASSSQYTEDTIDRGILGDSEGEDTTS